MPALQKTLARGDFHLCAYTEPADARAGKAGYEVVHLAAGARGTKGGNSGDLLDTVCVEEEGSAYG